MALKKFRIPFVPPELNATSEVDGGAVSAFNVEFRSTLGALTSRKQDEILTDDVGEVGIPQAYPTPKHIAQERNIVNGTSPLAMLAGTAAGTIDRLLVRGFKKFDGTLIGINSNAMRGWFAENGIAASGGNLDHIGHEARSHTAAPFYFGTPRNISERSLDFPFATVDGDYSSPDNAPLPVDSLFDIDGPFGESNVLEAPKTSDISLSFPSTTAFPRSAHDYLNGITGVTGTDSGLFGDNEGSMYGAAYFAVSYLYDGYQESALTLLGNYWVSARTGRGYKTILVDLILNVKVAGANARFRLPKRVRKIRLYCAPSSGAAKGNPLDTLQFRLVNEIDVGSVMRDGVVYGKADKHATVNRNRFYATVHYDGQTIDEIILSVPDREGYFDADGDASNRAMSLLNSAPRISMNGDEYCFGIKDITIDPLDLSSVSVELSDVGRVAFTEQWRTRHGNARSGNVVLSFGFRNYDYDINEVDELYHRTFVGEEFLSAPTYEELSGLPQNFTQSISPARRGGTSKSSIPVVWGVTDDDGTVHQDRIMKCMESGGVRTPDRFFPLDYVDVKFPIQTVVQHNGLDVVFGRNRVDMRSLADNMRDIEQSWQGIGAVSAGSVVDTPIGLFFLSDDGVRILSGIEISDPISGEIWEELSALSDYFDTAISSYSARRNEYELIIGYNADNRYKSTRWVYDLALRKWSGQIKTPLAVHAYCLGVNGDALLAMKHTNYVQSGVFKSGTSLEQYDDPEYTAKLILGDPLTEKTLTRLRLFYEQGGNNEFEVSVACERQEQTGLQNAETSRNYTFTPNHSGQVSKNLYLRDRSFNVTIKNFHKVHGGFVEFEETGREYEPANQ